MCLIKLIYQGLTLPTEVCFIVSLLGIDYAEYEYCVNNYIN